MSEELLAKSPIETHITTTDAAKRPMVRYNIVDEFILKGFSLTDHLDSKSKTKVAPLGRRLFNRRIYVVTDLKMFGPWPWLGPYFGAC